MTTGTRHPSTRRFASGAASVLILAGLPLAGSAIGGVVTASAAVADMSGTVFRDYDANGVRGASERTEFLYRPISRRMPFISSMTSAPPT